MTTADWAFVISLFSVAISLLSFVWNVWSKFIFPKPKVGVNVSVMTALIQGVASEDLPRFISLSATNYGPGEVTLHVALAKLKSGKEGLLNPLASPIGEADYVEGPFGGGLPKKLAVGEQFRVRFTLKHESLRDQVKAIGFQDTFGRYHWAPKKSLRDVQAKIRDVFPKQE